VPAPDVRLSANATNPVAFVVEKPMAFAALSTKVLLIFRRRIVFAKLDGPGKHALKEIPFRSSRNFLRRRLILRLPALLRWHLQ